MTNEELAIQIQAGNTQYYCDLWENTKRLLFKILKNKIAGLQLPNYLTYEDLQQEMYFTMCNAAQAYDSLKPFKFNSYLNYQVICTLRKLTAFKTNNRQFKEVSYNEPIRDKKDIKEDKIIEFIPCPFAEDKFKEIEMTDIQKIVREAVAELPERKKDIVNLFYLQGKTQENIGNLFKISSEAVRKERAKALHILRQNKTLKAYYREFERHYNHAENKYYRYELMWNTSKEKQLIKKQITQQRNSGKYISYGKEQSLLFQAKGKYIRNVCQNI